MLFSWLPLFWICCQTSAVCMTFSPSHSFACVLSKALSVLSLLVIHYFLLAIPSSCYHSILRHHDLDFPTNIFTAPYGAPVLCALATLFKHIHKTTVLILPQTFPTVPALPFCKMAVASQQASKDWHLLSKANLKYLTVTQFLMSLGLQTLPMVSTKRVF